MILKSLLLGVILTGVPSVSRAATTAWPEEYFNPQPIPPVKTGEPVSDLPPDFILPTPCGGAMAFRAVYVPAKDVLDDKIMTVGGIVKDEAYKESQRTDYIAGSFTDAKDSRLRLYYMGKYEVTRLQYAVVMAKSGSCPVPGDDSALPVTGRTWFDAVGFADSYTQWLLASAANQLPCEDGEPGFIRLPTEDEWEFAARGGARVADAEFAAPLPPMSQPLASYAWYAGSQSSNGQLQAIGLLLPNPLGMHDMMGNASEIVFDLFRLSRGARLHGEAGGFVVRGGSFRTNEKDIRSGWRAEIDPYRSDGVVKANDVGFRVAIVAPVLPTSERVRQVRQIAIDLPAVPILDAKLHDPIEEIEVLRKAAAEPAFRSGLDQLRADVSTERVKSRDEEALAARGRLDLAVWLLSDLLLETRPYLLYEARDRQRKPGEEPDDTAKRSAARVRDEFRSISSYYRDTLQGLVQTYPLPLLSDQAEVLRQELEQRQPDQVALIADVMADYAAYKTDGDRPLATITQSAKLKFCREDPRYAPCQAYR